MMASNWQVLIVAACSIILSTIAVIGDRIKINHQLFDNNGIDMVPLQTPDGGNQKTPASSQKKPLVYHSMINGANGRKGDDVISPVNMEEMNSLYARSLAAATEGAPIANGGDLATAAGHHHGHSHGKYYEYREVPKKKTWKFGYKRGNHKHTIQRHENGKAGKHPHFKTKVKWHDHKSKGKGVHLWDYNHHDKKHKYHG